MKPITNDCNLDVHNNALLNVSLEVKWDYSEFAASYDKRAEYSSKAVDFIVNTANVEEGTLVADIGAGTAKLTKRLLERGLVVHAVEPNANMRSFGIQNTIGYPVVWRAGTGEDTGLLSSTYRLVTFGSSFNVTDRQKTLNEVDRITVDNGWFACLWNHRDLEDKMQKEVEDVIHSYIPEYGYGSRREDQMPVLEGSGLFKKVEYKEFSFSVAMPTSEYLTAWYSHATLARQAKDHFKEIISKIESVVYAYGKDVLSVPYKTVLWIAQKK